LKKEKKTFVTGKLKWTMYGKLNSLV